MPVVSQFEKNQIHGRDERTCFLRTPPCHFDWSQEYDAILKVVEAEGEISEGSEISPSASTTWLGQGIYGSSRNDNFDIVPVLEYHPTDLRQRYKVTCLHCSK